MRRAKTRRRQQQSRYDISRFLSLIDKCQELLVLFPFLCSASTNLHSEAAHDSHCFPSSLVCPRRRQWGYGHERRLSNFSLSAMLKRNSLTGLPRRKSGEDCLPATRGSAAATWSMEKGHSVPKNKVCWRERRRE